ncbi:sulfatase [Reichenbachiella ulvae]|uniref:Sulfatase n=1 Tax=Reichenbachiella ulvae TaxID=2980104 RepID=A0ABT3D1H2_9BACT|nr:sulfatase [Reichenbachiella ulvae]MCV9389293.1 sulfatase [Reichenbachiella ulvae]
MNRIVSIVLVGLTMVACSPNNNHEEKNIPYNVLFIAIDDMNNWVGAMEGKAKTPNIDRLAGQGMLFSNAHCVVPACNASRVALMTGQRPETTGQYQNSGNFRNRPGGIDRVTIAQFLSQQGYETAAAGKIFHHPRGSGESADLLSDTASWDYQWVGNIGTEGRDQYLDENGFAKWHDGEIDGYLGKFAVWGTTPETKEETGDWKMSQFCAEFLQQKHDKPFFLAGGIFRPHAPLLAPQKYFDMYPLDAIELPEVPEDDMGDIPQIAKENFSTPMVKAMREKGEWKKAVQAYLASMTFADDCVGNILDALDNSPYKDNTIVVLWSDHGWQLGHKWRWEKFSLWNQGTNAPLIIKYPGMENPGKEVKQPVSYLSIYPTLLEILGVENDLPLEGESLMPLMNQPDMQWEIPAVVTYPKGSIGVKLDQWNYIKYKDGSEELYDHLVDPREYKNLANDEQYASIMAKLSKFIPKGGVPEQAD